MQAGFVIKLWERSAHLRAPVFIKTDILFSQGISYESDVLNAAVTRGVVKKSGASFSFEGERLGVGFDNARLKLKEDKKLVEEIKKKIIESMNRTEEELEKGGNAGSEEGVE